MSMRKLLDSEEKVKYSGFWAVIGMFWAFSAQAQVPYLDEVKALGAVAGQEWPAALPNTALSNCWPGDSYFQGPERQNAVGSGLYL